MAANGDVSERPSPAKVRGVFPSRGWVCSLSVGVERLRSRVGQPEKLGVIYVLESVLRPKNDAQVYDLNRLFGHPCV